MVQGHDLYEVKAKHGGHLCCSLLFLLRCAFGGPGNGSASMMLLGLTLASSGSQESTVHLHAGPYDRHSACHLQAGSRTGELVPAWAEERARASTGKFVSAKKCKALHPQKRVIGTGMVHRGHSSKGGINRSLAMGIANRQVKRSQHVRALIRCSSREILGLLPSFTMKPAQCLSFTRISLILSTL